jgi:hypothetical protein
MSTSIKYYIERESLSYDPVLFYGANLKDSKDGLVIKSILKKINNVNSDSDKKNYSYFYKLSVKDGGHSFTYNDTPMIVELIKVSEPIYDEHQNMFLEHYKVMIQGKDEDTIKSFLGDAQIFYDEHIRSCKKDIEKVNIYMWDEYIWEILQKTPKRKLETLYFENKFLDDLKNRISKFLDNKTEERYKNLGIPYKLNLLFEGLPGTGKTSLIYGLASHFNMNIAILNFDKDITDSVLMKCLKRLPENTILILEDIDVLFKERKENDTMKSQISFSGLLNSLDGIGSPYKQIVIMTTNYKCNLDKALQRPGRVDISLNFTYSTKKQTQKMFNSFFPNHTKRFSDFYEEIRNLQFTTAMLQQYLFQYFNFIDEDDIDIEKVINNVEILKNISTEHSYDSNKNLYT